MNQKLFDKLSVSDLLLLHLDDILELNKKDYQEYTNQLVEILEVGEKKIEKFYSKLKEDGKIEVTRNTQKETKHYTLTEEGEKEKERIWSEIKEKKILLIDENDAIQLKLKNVVKVLDDIPLVKIIVGVDGQGVLDLREGEKPRYGLVGREEELKKIIELTREINEGSKGTLFIAGETGIGKTRLVEELKSMALEKDFDFLNGRCLPEDQAPYAPFKRALSKFLDIERELGKVHSVISPSPPNRGKVKNQEMFDTQRKSIFYRTSQFLKNLSEFRTIVMFFDNLQWADSGTLNLLDYMAEKLENEQVILIGAYRPSEVDESDPLKDTLHRMSRKKLYDKIELQPLESEDIKTMVSKITGIDEVPTDFIDNLEEKTNGNPLFVRESIREMLKEGLIDLKRAEFPSEAEIFHIPDVIQNVIEKRVYELREGSREVLQLGSVVGKHIPFELLVSASDKDELRLLEDIDPLLETNIWEEDPREEAFTFSHDMFVDTVYDGIGKWIERKKLHLEIAKAMENVFEDRLENRYFTLGYHFREGERYQKAFKYFVRAGDKAEKVYAHEDAIDRYEEALSIANKTDEIEEEQSLSLLEKLGEIHNTIGGYEESRKYLNRGLLLVDDVEEKRGIYKNIAKSWFNQGEFDRVIEITNEGLSFEDDESVSSEDEIKEESPYKKKNTAEICNLLSRKGWALMTKGNYDEAKEIFSEELEKARELGDRSILAQAYHDLASMERGGLNTQDCIEYLNKAIEIRKEIIAEKGAFKEKNNLFRSYNNLGAIYFELRDFDKSLSLFEKALDINEEIKNKMFEALALNNIAVIKSIRGNLEESEEILKDVFDISEGIVYKHGQFLAENTMGAISQERGRLDLALGHFEDGMEIAEEMDFKFGIIDSYENIARMKTFKGKLDEAEEYIKEGYELADKIENDRSKGKVLRLMGKIKRLKGDLEEAIKYHREGIDLNAGEDENPNLFWNRCELVEDHLANGDIEKAEENFELARGKDIETKDSDSKLKLLSGIILREKGNLEKAEDSLKRSLELTEYLSKKYRIARIKYEQGKLKKKMENFDEAKDYLNEAKELFEEMDMELRKEKTKEELDSLGP